MNIPTNKKRVLIIFGTRPEAIKLAPLILELKKNPLIQCRVCNTGQHKEMVNQVLDVFDIIPDINLNIMTDSQSLAGLTARLIDALDLCIITEKPDIIVIQGDTTTVFCSALVAFYSKIPIAHVEAGLRTGDLYSPWPEEFNRLLTSKISVLHFAPTECSQNNLLKEGIPKNRIYVTGNTIIDSLFIALKKVTDQPPEIPGLPDRNFTVFADRKVVLITGHRRENFGDSFDSLCHAILELSELFTDVHFVYPVHLNPNVQEPVYKILGNNKINIHLINPLPYLAFISLLNRSTIVLTDSGGIQEEAPSLGKPVLVTRSVSERPEGLSSGTVKLVGTEMNTIVSEISKLLLDSQYYNSMANRINPYGDGTASIKINSILSKFLYS